jgi:hypothetical protein
LVPEFAKDNACTGKPTREKTALQWGPFACGESWTAYKFVNISQGKIFIFTHKYHGFGNIMIEGGK